MPILTLQPNAADGVDTFLRSDTPTLNRGLNADLLIRGTTDFGGLYSKGLLQFSLATLPVGAIVTSAILTGYVSIVANNTARTMGVHRGLTQWYEGAKLGAAPDPGTDGSTWNLRNVNGALAWAGGAGGGAGSDYAAVATATASITSAGAYVTWDITADVVAWVGGVANYGVWLVLVTVAPESYKYVASSDHATARVAAQTRY